MSKEKQTGAASRPAHILKEGEKGAKAEGEDLTTILDKSQQAYLTLLIANATESMRKLLVDNFDATAGLDKKLLREEGMTEDEKMMSTDPTQDVSLYGAEKKKKEAIERDLETLKMKNLKKNSLKAYDRWRENVVRRVGQAIDMEMVAKQQLETEAKAQESQPHGPITLGKISEIPSTRGNLRFRDLFPPTKTPLTKLSMEKRALILHSILLLLLSLEHYNAPSRILLLNLTSSLKLPLSKFEQDEYTTAKGLLEAAKELTADEETKKKAEENKESRRWNVRMATVAGAAILGISGGMAAPLIAAGVGSVMGGLGLGATAAASYLGSVAGSTLIVGTIFGAYGGRMTGEMMDNYAREVEDFEFLPVHSRNKTSEDEKKGAEQASDHDHKLRVTVCVSGWLTDKNEVVKPWRVLGTAAEVFALKFELEALLNLGNSMNGMVTSAAWGYAQKELISRTIFADLAGAMWPIGLMKVARVIDNPFSVAKGRADKAGEVMADALVNKAQGERPVTLIGYSMGARVIYTCLMSLAKRKAFNLIENVVMIGTPSPSNTSDWRVLRSVVSGRLVNVYSEDDYVLGFMYRTSAMQYGVAGLQKIEGLAGVENVDVSEEIRGHLKYRYLIGAILKKIGFEDIDMKAVEEEAAAMKKMEKEEKKQSLRSQRKRLLRQQSYQGGKVDEEVQAEQEISSIEKKVQNATQRSLVSKAIEWWYTPSIPNEKDMENLGINIQKGLQNPADARAALTDTYNDINTSGRSYARWAAEKLPSMPYISVKSLRDGTSFNPSKSIGNATEAAGDATVSAQSYTQAAAERLPKMPKNLPSILSLPSRATKAAPRDSAVKSLADVTKKKPIIHQAQEKNPSPKAAGTAANSTLDNISDTRTCVSDKAGQEGITTPLKASGSSKAAASSAHGAQKSDQSYASVATTYFPSVRSTTKGYGTKKKAGTADDISKGTTGEASKTASDTSKATKTNPQSYTEMAANYLPSMRAKSSTSTRPDAKPKVGDAGNTTKFKDSNATTKSGDPPEGLTNKPGDAGKVATNKAEIAPKNIQSYTSMAASYLPSISGRSSKKSPPPNPGKPAAPSRTATDINKDISKLDNVSTGAKSTSPRVERIQSSTKPTPKLDRLPSGMKSPLVPTKLNRMPSGVKSPQVKFERTGSGIENAPGQGAKGGQDVGGKSSNGV